MSRDPSGIYTYPDGTRGTPGTTIFSARYNTFLDDLAVTLNTALPINMGGTGASTPTTALTALGGVAKAGDTMTGDLTISKATPLLNLNKPTDIEHAGIVAKKGAGLSRWLLSLADNTAETGSNTGSNLTLFRYNDAGSLLGSSLIINRATGNATFSGTVYSNGGGFLASGWNANANAGVVILNQASNRLVGFDGTKYVMPGAALSLTGTITLEPAGAILQGQPCVINIGTPVSWYGIAFRPVNTVNDVPLLFCNYATAQVGTVSTTVSATAYNTGSDGRLKEDLKSFDAGNIIDNTMVYDFAWKETGERTYGVIGQQAKEVYPTAVTYHEQSDWWGVDYSKYVPVLLQELKALRARVAVLEGKLLTGIQPA